MLKLSGSVERGAFKDIDLNLAKGDKIIVYSKDSRATSLFMILSTIRQRQTLELSIGSHNHSKLPITCRVLDTDMNLVDWLRQYAQTEEEREEVCVDFLGKMIFWRSFEKCASSFRR
jgi:hypothetical protein